MDKDIYLYRHEQAAQTKNRIFVNANELFNEKGFKSVTIRDICKRSNIAVGTFYLHYQSKHDILYDLYKRVDERVGEKGISEQDSLDSLQKILELIRIQLSAASIFHIQSDAVKQLYSYQLESDNEYFLSEDRQFYIQLTKVIDEGKVKHEIRTDITTHDICWRLLRFSRGIIFDWCLHNCSYDIVGFGSEEIAFYLESFRD
ncbi:MAG: TetR/AcrR family transcriptional regulator [Lacrimispora sp.]